MSFEIEGIRYYTTSEVLEAAGITRQTLWRWRNEAKVPRGNRFRNGRIVFTEQEFRAVIEFANRIEPDAPILDPRQLRLFKDVGS